VQRRVRVAGQRLSIAATIRRPDGKMVRPSSVALAVALEVACPSGVVPVTANRAGTGSEALCIPSRPKIRIVTTATHQQMASREEGVA
jgi:hypothetical protein